MSVSSNCYFIILVYVYLENYPLGATAPRYFFYKFFLFLQKRDVKKLNCRSPPINTKFQNLVLIGGYFYGQQS